MLRNLIKKLLSKYNKMSIKKIENKKIKQKQVLVKRFTISEQEKQDINNIWNKYYGQIISLDWHRLYASYTGNLDKNYFPEIFFTSNLLDKLNPPKRRAYLADKILTQYLFNNIDEENFKLIKTYAYNCNGYFYNENGIIKKQDALDLLKNIGKVIIKPSVDTNSGSNVRMLDIKNGVDTLSNKSLEQVLKEYGKNYMIQEVIKQHKCMQTLNPSSVNTIRINTYICDGEVYSTPVAMRIGRAGSIVDNAHAGGVQIGITSEETLRKYAFTEHGDKFEQHPDTNIVFEGYKILKVNEMISFAKRYHHRVPHMGIIAWDFTLDENENIVLIETNITCPTLWFPQYANGEAFFGQNTVKMISKLKDKE